MSGILTPGERPGQWQTAGDHDRRIRALEALQDCCAQGTVCTSWPDRVSQLAAEDPDSLLGWWRLGDGASPYADSSGHSGGPANMVRTVQGTAMTLDYTPGALAAGEDDGAVAFNGSTSFALADILVAADSRFELPASSDWTLAAWVLPRNVTGAQGHHVLGSFSPSNGGYGFFTTGSATPVVFFQIGDSGGQASVSSSVIPPNEWTFVACVYQPDATGLLSIYLDGELDAQGVVVQGLNEFPSIMIGGNGSGGPVYNSLNAAVDEAMVWGKALTEEDLGELFRAGACSNDVSEGMVLTADGAGGTVWAYPTIEVTENGV